MRRQVFRIVSASSLVLCFATVAVWVKSHTTGTELGIEIEAEASPSNDGLFPINLDRRLYYLAADRGGISYTVDHERSSGVARGWSVFQNNFPRGDANNGPPDVGFLGFGYRTWGTHLFGGKCWREWTVPYWSLVLVLACLPALAVGKSLRARRRQQLGHCRSCGYELRATPDVCPECGAVSA